MSGITIVVVGPPATAIGGMAEAVRRQCTLDLGRPYCVRYFATSHAFSPSEGIASRALRHARRVAALRSFVRGHNADIVHIHTCSGFSFFRAAADMLAVQSLKCRVLLHIHGASFHEFYARCDRVRRAAVRWLLSRANGVICLSSWWYERLRAMAPDARIFVVENAVDIPPRPRPYARRCPCRFVHMARMDTWKGVDDLLDAAQLLRQQGGSFQLDLVGPSGSAGSACVLVKKIIQRDLRSCVRYIGPVHGTRKESTFASADVLVIPSHHEGMPLVMLEAMARGVPVLATRVGAIPEVIAHGTHGQLVEPHLPDRLAAAMSDMAADPDARLEMSRAARELAVTRFGTQRLRADYRRVYVAVMSPARGARPHAATTSDVLYRTSRGTSAGVYAAPTIT